MKKIRLFQTYMSMRSIWNVSSLLVRSNFGGYIGEGPEVKKFESEFEKKFGLKYVVSVNSGSSALELAFELAGIGEGDEVIIPVLTHPSTCLPVVRRKANTVFADVDSDLNVSVMDVKKKITAKTKAIVFVHFGGNNRGLKEMLELARENKILLIEDAAQAVGSKYWGKADFTCVSLQAIKTLTSGDGGFLVCNDIETYNKARRLRWFGYDREEKQRLDDTDLLEVGYKYHMNDIIASIGRGNLHNFDVISSRRTLLMEEYLKNGITAHFWFALALTDDRTELKAFLKERGVESGVHHYRNDKYTIFGGRQKLINMDELENKYLLLPLHMGMTTADVRKIARVVHEFEHLKKSPQSNVSPQN